MWEIVWLDSAVNDIVRLKTFITKDNPNAANQAAKAIKESVQLVSEYPSIGKPVDDLPQYRDLLIRFGAGGYIQRYRVHLEIIYIVQVRHYRENHFKL